MNGSDRTVERHSAGNGATMNDFGNIILTSTVDTGFGKKEPK